MKLEVMWVGMRYRATVCLHGCIFVRWASRTQGVGGHVGGRDMQRARRPQSLSPVSKKRLQIQGCVLPRFIWIFVPSAANREGIAAAQLRHRSRESDQMRGRELQGGSQTSWDM